MKLNNNVFYVQYSPSNIATQVSYPVTERIEVNNKKNEFFEFAQTYRDSVKKIKNAFAKAASI